MDAYWGMRNPLDGEKEDMHGIALISKQ